MTESRSPSRRKSDVIAALELNADLWLATAGTSGRPQLIPVSAWWDGSSIVIATTGGSISARNLEASRSGRLALGSPADAILVDVTVSVSVPVEQADAEMVAGFTGAVGWNPAEVGPGWRFFRLRPVRIQAYRGYDEVEGRDVMRDSRWLD
ncbi:MAG: pyridoxamine 5'-phosphate oxidase family protein [Candidatus Dormibacteraeota bacterium]|nr:pyridoxamine 5'-phosphate oxidase family protein [Candidatus Dormibacteraeota bacterium]